MLKEAHLGILMPLNQGHTRKYAGHGPGYYPMIQNGPPSKSGSYHSLIPNAAKAWGLPVEGCTASEPQRILDALSSGRCPGR